MRFQTVPQTVWSLSRGDSQSNLEVKWYKARVYIKGMGLDHMEEIRQVLLDTVMLHP